MAPTKWGNVQDSEGSILIQSTGEKTLGRPIRVAANGATGTCLTFG